MVCTHPLNIPRVLSEVIFAILPHDAHFQPWVCVSFRIIQVKRGDHSSACLFIRYKEYNDIYSIDDRFYSANKNDIWSPILLHFQSFPL